MARPATFVAAQPELLITPADPPDQRATRRRRRDLHPVSRAGSVGRGSDGRMVHHPGRFIRPQRARRRAHVDTGDDHPSDQATFRFELTVPTGLTAVANGALIDHTSTATTETWVWQEDRPMATYLIQLLTGDYELVEGSAPTVCRSQRGVARGPGHHADATSTRSTTRSTSSTTSSARTRSIATASPSPTALAGWPWRPWDGRCSVATTSPRADWITLQELLLSHELAHQWFGDAVSPARWIDVWLNESFATYGEWMWLDHVGMRTIEDSAIVGPGRSRT